MWHYQYDALGRRISKDYPQKQIGLNGGERPFGYVDNPLDWVDLFGLTSCQLTKAIENSGISRPANFAAYHIVPETAKTAEPF